MNTPSFKSFVEFFGKQLDPDFVYEPASLSPRHYFAQYSARDYIRIVIIVGAYALIIRPLLEKGMSRLRDRATERGDGPQPIPVDLPAWQQQQQGNDDDDNDDNLDWGAKLRRRAREAQAKKDREAEAEEMRDEDLDKYLD